jgi:hypothetical protein
MPRCQHASGYIDTSDIEYSIAAPRYMRTYVFEPDYELESIEDHSEFMLEKGHLRAVPKATQDEKGKDVVEYGALLRGLLEELEKAHLYIASLDNVVKQQRTQLSELSSRVEALASA